MFGRFEVITNFSMLIFVPDFIENKSVSFIQNKVRSTCKYKHTRILISKYLKFYNNI